MLFDGHIILRNIAAYTPYGSNYQSRKKKIKFNAVGFDYSICAGFLREYKVENDNRVVLTRDIIFKSTERGAAGKIVPETSVPRESLRLVQPDCPTYLHVGKSCRRNHVFILPSHQ